MNDSTAHPSDEELAALVLEGNHSAIAAHVRACADCTRRMQGFAEVRDSVAALPEEDLPGDLRHHLTELREIKRKTLPGFILSVMGSPFWYPILAGLTALALMLFLFFVYVSIR